MNLKNIVKTLIDKFQNLNKKTKKIMHIGFIICSIICIISLILLFTYIVFYSLPNLFYCGISLFKTSLMFACCFCMFGIGFDTLLKQIT